ncbi:hypothetical protein CU098_007073 [Rhizopus stolonifer]|uniref:Uncharacterized protein n=1 Tax=Rhizopus stolonifer TaxID=4846 RepID=A0A367JHC3_RHIST|nr:hypothetical protein CU098_007073 [Rhizopus stolonifer]
MLIVAFILIGLYVFMNKINRKRQELMDIEQRIIEVKGNYTSDRIKMYEPAIVKEDIYFQPNPPAGPPVMTPKKKNGRKSILCKIYSFRNASTSPPLSPRKPSSLRSPSFLPMQENRLVHPPTYEDSVVSLSNQKH